MSQKGVIYILTNPSFKEYVKIGYADDVETRLKQLNNSECIPFAFRVYATYEVEDRLTDIKLHSLIDHLNPNLRSIDNVNGKKRVREFYAMSPEQAYSILETIAIISGRKERLHLYELSADERKDEELAQEINEERIERLLKLQDEISLENNQKYVGSTVTVLVDSLSKRKDMNTVNARTYSNKLVHFEGDESMIGKYMSVKIERAGVYELYATKNN